jgi:hypothetical protein
LQRLVEARKHENLFVLSKGAFDELAGGRDLCDSQLLACFRQERQQVRA